MTYILIFFLFFPQNIVIYIYLYVFIAPIVGTLVVQGTPSRYAVSSDHGGGAWAGFAQNAIATGANPSNVAILNPQVGVVWMDDNKNVGY